MDVVWSVESQGAEVGGDDDQVDGEAQTDEENHGDQGTVSQDYGVFIKPPHVPHPAVEQCEVVGEAGGAHPQEQEPHPGHLCAIQQLLRVVQSRSSD